jgi:parallel beta-helix repeat protein
VHRLRPLLALLALVLAAGPACDLAPDYASYQVVPVPADPLATFETRLRDTLLSVKPGTIVELPAGTFPITNELSLAVSHVVIRGQGMDQTILDFGGQTTGAQGLLVTEDEFVMQDLAAVDMRGDGIRVEGADGVTFDRVRVEWTNGPLTSNGAYGLYPVQTNNVLIQNCVVKGASDAGIYVGQSTNIIVRWNLVMDNVAGIEIENSRNADVYMNRVTQNTGGILVFDNPGLPVKLGRSVRVMMNAVYDNDRKNFGQPGSSVGLVPGGSGVIVLANDDVEIFLNWISGHDTINLGIASYLITMRPYQFDPVYDPYPERLNVHDNVFGPGGDHPQDKGELADLLGLLFLGRTIPDVVWDGAVDPLKAPGSPPQVPSNLRVCMRDNGPATWANIGIFNTARSEDLGLVDCEHAAITPVVLHAPTPPPFVQDPYTPAEIDALCNAPGSDVNWPAFVVNCPELSDYRLFVGNDPTGTPQGGGMPFDLTTPLFSDYATKYRVAFLPPGTSATYHDTAAFDFPVGTIIAKTFSFQNDLRAPALGERWIETRLLIHRATGWVGMAYVWADDRSEATLAIGGGAKPVAWTHFDGTPRSTVYEIPNANQCTACHSATGVSAPIGPKARLLNKDFAYAGGAENQIARWANAGILAGVPALPVAQLPRLPVWNDPGDGTLEQRARGYLESNCAHCHNPNGRARFSGLFLGAAFPLDTPHGVCKSPTSAGAGAGGLLYDLVPGAPQESIIVYRMASVEPAIKMPELAKSVVHQEGVDLVTAWIQTVPGTCP